MFNECQKMSNRVGTRKSFLAEVFHKRILEKSVSKQSYLNTQTLMVISGSRGIYGGCVCSDMVLCSSQKHTC